MALHTKKEFAKLCGLTTGNLSNYEGRRKIMYSGDYVDDSIEPNISFLQKRQLLLKNMPAEMREEVAEQSEREEIKTSKVKESATRKKEYSKPVDNYRPPIPNTTQSGFQMDGSLLALEKEKLVLQNQKLVEEVQLAKKKNEKIAEESVLVEHVRALIIIQSESGKIAWENAVEDLLVTMTREFQLPREKVAIVKGEVNDIINNALNRAAAESHKTLKRLQSDYANKRGKGERL
jgi:hypothetical protein